jgi:hypothetical protein
MTIGEKIESSTKKMGRIKAIGNLLYTQRPSLFIEIGAFNIDSSIGFLPRHCLSCIDDGSRGPSCRSKVLNWVGVQELLGVPRKGPRGFAKITKVIIPHQTSCKWIQGSTNCIY